MISTGYRELSNATERNVLSMVFEDIIKLLVAETSRYAHTEKNNPTFKTDSGEMARFLGILFLTGCNRRGAEPHYWNKAEDLECPIVANTISSKRFKEIKSLLHVADNQNLELGRMGEVQPLHKNSQMQRLGILCENLSID